MSGESSSEGRPLLQMDPTVAAAAASAGAGLLNASTQEIQKARLDGPLTFRMLGFLGGIAMIISNGIAILERFFSFHFANALIAIYGVLFGILITMLEAPSCPAVPFCAGQRLDAGIRFYCKFLEFTWGRGLLYFFVGTLQVANWNMLDWAVGGFMIFVGLTAMGAGINAARQLRLLRFAMKDENALKETWNKHDADGSGSLDVKELTKFVQEAGVDMSRNEIAATYMKLDKNFDEKLTYEEFYYWWQSTAEQGSGGGGAKNYSV
jgi:EF-hand domain pair/COPI associated protein